MNNFLVKTSGLTSGKDQADGNSVKTLMLLHGWGMNSQVWEPIREALESQYHLLWIDLPGHGFNRDVEAQSLEQIVTLVAGGIAEIAPENIHMIGWSLGGLVAQALAQNIPHRIKSITLVTSTPRFSQSLQAQDGDWQHAMSDEVLNRFADNLKKDTEKTLKGFIALQFIGVTDAKLIQGNLINQILYNGKSAKKAGGVFSDDTKESESASKSEQSLIPTQEALDVGLDILKHVDLRKLTLSCPEHWVFAEYDRLIPKEVINDLISLRPDAEITLIDKAGHAPFITHPEIFLKRVTDFIEALD
ncbi:MAG: alpha/beta fold hydrolase [Cocleimonas sp.]